MCDTVRIDLSMPRLCTVGNLIAHQVRILKFTTDIMLDRILAELDVQISEAQGTAGDGCGLVLAIIGNCGG